MFSKRSGTKDSGASLNREDFIISLVMPMEIFRANKSDTGGALKQAVAGMNAMVEKGQSCLGNQ
jgi:hypothetical protein